VANRELVIPRYAEKIARTKNDVVGSRQIGVHCAIDDPGRILNARILNPKEGELHWLYIIEPQKGREPSSLIQADSARYDAGRRTWVLERGKRVRPSDPEEGEGLGAAVREETVLDYPFGLTPEQLVLRRASQWADYMSLPQLNALLQSRNLPNRPTIDASRHARITEPITQFILVALVLPFFLLRAPGSVIAAAGRSLLMGGALVVTTFVSQAITPEERFAPLAAWAPILIFGPLAVVRIANVRT
jgi:lipopolysaccharide export LptBFGC system permease protein LptF